MTKTGCDSLAIAIGTSHGAYKFTAAQCTRNEKGILVPPPLRFDVLHECEKRLPGFPIVLHGSSSVPQDYVKMINENGGRMPDAVGIPEEQLREAARSAVCKINIDSDLRLAMTGTIRQFFNEHPDKFDPKNIEARKSQYQGIGAPQAGGCSGLQRQSISFTRCFQRGCRKVRFFTAPPIVLKKTGPAPCTFVHRHRSFFKGAVAFIRRVFSPAISRHPPENTPREDTGKAPWRVFWKCPSNSPHTLKRNSATSPSFIT